MAVFSSFFSLFSMAELHQTDVCLQECSPARRSPAPGGCLELGRREAAVAVPGESLLCELCPPRTKKGTK